MKRLFLVAAASCGLILVLAAVVHWLDARHAAERRQADWRDWQEHERFAERVLNQTVSLKGGRLTLSGFADQIAHQCQITVEIDEPSLSASHWSPKQFLDMPPGSFSVRAVLELMLDSDLCVDFRRGNVVITTVDASVDRNRLRTVVYPLPQDEPSGMNEETWSDLVSANDEPFHWNFKLGSPHAEAVPGALVVVHSNEGHRHVRWLISTFSRIAESSSPGILWPPTSLNSQRQRMLTALESTSACNFVETPFHEAIGALARRHNVPIIVRGDKLKEASVSTRTPLTRSINGISLGSLLQLLLNDLELTFFVHDEALVVTTREDAGQRLIVAAYDVHDLVSHIPEAPFDADWDSLIDLIIATVHPDAWDDMSGPGPAFGYGDRWLVFAQTEAVHQQVRDLLAQLRHGLAPADAKPALAPTAAEQAERKIIAALDQVVQFDSSKLSLKDAIALLQRKVGIPIVVSAKKLEEASVSLDTPVTSALGTASAYEHLHALLEPLELTMLIRNEVLQITTPEDAESNMVTRVYDTRAIIDNGIAEDELRDLMERGLHDTSWAIVGGPGMIDFYRGLLVVTQSAQVHRDIPGFLSSIKTRRAGRK